jgi:predicted ATPase/DNA-binding SARP family transcriptional activator
VLPGLYEDWALRERERVAQEFLGALRELAAALEQAGEPGRAIECLHRVVADDPLLEEAYSDLMRLYVAVGQSAAAMRQYRELARVLRLEMNVRPSAATCALAETLFRHPPADAAASSRPPPESSVSGPAPPARPAASVAIRPTVLRTSAHLPLLLTRFFGREEEIAQLTQGIGVRGPGVGDSNPAARLVTLTGPGGSGKTRLALEIARQLQERFGGAVWFVSLADTTDAGLLPDKLLQALRLERSAHDEPFAQTVAFLSRQPSLLILDNFEQLLTADSLEAESGAQFVWNLLEQLPDLTCIVTSRQRLDIGGEREFPVQPLPLPAQAGSPERLLDFASIRLFVDRAQLARPDFQITGENAPAILALCARLEGIPLAEELAAAWAATLTPAQMLARLERGMELLSSKSRNVPPRHRTLRAAIEWSYRLLPPDLQTFFARLSVFRGGWTLEAAEAIVEEEGGGRREEKTRAWIPPLEALAQLRERSLIVAVESGEEMRYRLLETLREYAGEQLTPEERAALAQRHLDYFLSLTEQAETGLRGPEQALWAERLDREQDNLRVALEKCLREGLTETGLRLAGALADFWQTHGYAAAGRRWLEALLAQSGDETTASYAKALSGLSLLILLHGETEQAIAILEKSQFLYRQLGDRPALAEALRRMHNVIYLYRRDPERAMAMLEESMALCREAGDRRGIATTLGNMGSLTRELGDYETAETLYHQSAALHRSLGDRNGLAVILAEMGYLLTAREDLERARTHIEESLTLYRQLKNKYGIGHALWLLGRVADAQGNFVEAISLLTESAAVGRETGARQQVINAISHMGIVAERQGDFVTARQRCEECLALAKEMGERYVLARMFWGVGHACFQLRDYAAARRHYRESLRLWQGILSPQNTLYCLDMLAQTACGERQAERAVCLFAAAQAQRKSAGEALPPETEAAFDGYIAEMRALLDAETFAAAWERGHALTGEQAIAWAIETDAAA